MSSRSARLTELLAFVFVAACERTPPPPTGADDARSAEDAGIAAVEPAPADAVDGGLIARRLPRITDRVGPFIAQPRITTVTFKNDEAAHVARVDAFAETITKTAWWREVARSYCRAGACIGEGSGSRVHLDELMPAEATPEDLEARLVKHVKSLRPGTVDPARDLFVFVLPKGVRLQEKGGGKPFCEPGAPRAYHRTAFVAENAFAYAVVPRCADVDRQLASMSHEILEATTNPDPAQRGFAFVGDVRISGFGFAGLEPVDPCGLVTMDDHTVFEAGFPLHRAWSNRAAAEGRDPCVPARVDRPYALLVPRADAVRLKSVGDTTTIVVDGSSAQVTGPWTISAFDLTGAHDNESYVEVSFDRANVKRGESATLRVTSKKAAPGHRSVVGLVSTVGVATSMWPLLVAGP